MPPTSSSTNRRHKGEFFPSPEDKKQQKRTSESRNNSRSESISQVSAIMKQEDTTRNHQKKNNISNNNNNTRSEQKRDDISNNNADDHDLSVREQIVLRAAVHAPFHKAHASFGTEPRFVPVTEDGYVGHEHRDPFPGPGEYELDKPHYPSLQRQVEQSSRVRQEQSFMDQSYHQAKEEDLERRNNNNSSSSISPTRVNNNNNSNNISVVASNFPSLLSPFHKSHATFGTGPRFVPVTIDGYVGHEHRDPFPGPGEYRLPASAPTMQELVDKEERVHREQVQMDTSYHQTQEVEQREKEKAAAKKRESVNNSVISSYQSPKNASILKNITRTPLLKREASTRSSSVTSTNANNTTNNTRGGTIGRAERFLASPSSRTSTPSRNNNNVSASSLGRHSENNANKPRVQHGIPINAEQRKAYIKQIVDSYKSSSTRTTNTSNNNCNNNNTNHDQQEPTTARAEAPAMLPNFSNNNNSNAKMNIMSQPDTPRGATTSHQFLAPSPTLSARSQSKSHHHHQNISNNNNNRTPSASSSSIRHDTLSSVLRRSASQVARETPANHKEQSRFEKSFEQRHQVRTRNASPMYRKNNSHYDDQQQHQQRPSSSSQVRSSSNNSNKNNNNQSTRSQSPVTVIGKTKREFTHRGGVTQSSEYQNLDAFFSSWLKNAKQTGAYQSPRQ